MKFLIDMNLSPKWRTVLEAEGFEGVHWSEIGSPSAPDHEVMRRALNEQRIVLTHDLDFGAILASTRATGPSVVQVRTHDVRPRSLAPLLLPLLRQHESELTAGALLIVDASKSRVRLLPLANKPGP